MVRALAVATLLAGCATDATDTDVTGPFTGTPRRYVVDGFTLPTNNTTARALGGDLDGNKSVDNQLGMVIATLGQSANLTTHAPDMIASGVIASSVIIRADNLVDDPTVSVIYFGSDGDPATQVGGAFVDGTFISNRSAITKVPGDAIVRLPVFADADPSDVALTHMQMELVPDGDGYIAAVHGTIEPEQAFVKIYEGLTQLIAAEPDDHRLMVSLFDTNRDYAITYEEVRTNSLMTSLLEPDVTVGGDTLLSIGFHVHLEPCDAGTCVDAPPANACFDRVKNGDESDVDCGGSCRSCKAPETCGDGSDCESGACDGGVCRAPSCTDGVRDGFETDVDCGGPCDDCAIGARCFSNGDCASGQCGEPCTNPDPLGCIDLSSDFDTCRAAP